MEKKIIKGRDFLLFLPNGDDFTAVGASTDCTLTLSHSPIPIASPDLWPWTGAVRGSLSWGITLTAYHHFGGDNADGGERDPLEFFDDLDTPLLAVFSTVPSSERERPLGGYVPDLRRARAGYVLPVVCEDSAPADGLATASLSFQGVGPLLRRPEELRALLDQSDEWNDGRVWRDGEQWHA